MSAPDFRIAQAVEMVKGGSTLTDALARHRVAANSLRVALRRAGVSYERPALDYLADLAERRTLRLQARQAVLEAGLPLFRRTVDRAEMLIEQDETVDRVNALLKREFGGSDVQAS